jgi:beta-lactamase superfamily II metal-dependent hydrolase
MMKFILYHFWFCLSFLIVIRFSDAVMGADLGIESTIFNVRQGNGVVVRDKHRGISSIIDAGNSGSDTETVPLLKRFNTAIFGKGGLQKRERLRSILLSHSDGDHVKLLTRVIHANSRALKDQNKSPTSYVTAYLGSHFNEYLVGDGLACLDALIAVNVTLRSLSHVITPEQAKNKNIHACAVRPFFMNVLIPEFSDPARGLVTVIMAANASHKGVSKFLGTIDFPGDLNDATPDANTRFSGGKNDNGAVYKFIYRGKNIIFPGDVDGKCTDRLVINVPESIRDNFLIAHILLAAHHGAERERTNNIAWLLASDPHHVIVSAGERDDYIHPSLSVLFSIASIVRINTFRSSLHLIQCGDRTGSIIKNSAKLKEQFCVPAGIEIGEKEINGFRWLQIWTPLPLYTTSTLGDQIFLITRTGDIIFT